MATEKPINQTKAGQFGYWLGAALRDGYRRIAAFEAHCAQRTGERDWPIGSRGIRVLFVVAKAAIVGLTLCVGLWLAVSVLTLVTLAFVVARGFPIEPMDTDDYLANGDPYGEYKYGRSAGQPDLEDIP